MSEHDDIERVLSQYRPASPPAALRNRILAGPERARLRVSNYIKWSAAAAALVAAVLSHIQASRTFDAVAIPAAYRATQQRISAIDEMTSALGGGGLARRAAEQWYDTAHVGTPAPSRAAMEALWNQ